MAFGMSSFSTSVGISAEYAGPPKDWATPETNDRQRISQTWTTSLATRIVAISAEYAGSPKDWATPETNDRQRISQTWKFSLATSTVRIASLCICTYWE